MRYRLAGSLSLLAYCLLGLCSPVLAQDYPGGPSMAAWSPAWSMPPGSVPPGGMPPGMQGPGMPPGMMQGQGMPPGLMGGQMPPGMAEQAAYQEFGGQDFGGGMGGQMPMDQRHQDGGFAPGGCTDSCDPCAGATRAGLLRRGLLKGRCASGGCGGIGGGPFAGGGDGWDGSGGLLGNCVGFRWMRFLLPSDDGGACAVRWYDVAVDFLTYTRDDTGADRVFARRGDTAAAPFALGSNQLDFDHEPGFRIMANIQFGSANSIEFGYTCLRNNSLGAQTTSPQHELTSVISNFATFPNGGFVDTDFVDLQTLDYSSELDSFELNYRTRWMSPECRYQGSWLAGVRYISFNDDLLYQTFASRGRRMEFLTNTNNSLTGFQLGGDLWICPLAGLRFGVEGKAGVYGNYSHAGATINTTRPFNYVEDSQSSDAAFVGELNFNMLYRINHNYTLRLGYNFLVMEGVALATDNFNPTPPNAFAVNRPAGMLRQPSISNNGDVLFHGLNVGLEYMW